jgi:hypothetical protein
MTRVAPATVQRQKRAGSALQSIRDMAFLLLVNRAARSYALSYSGPLSIESR